MKIDYENLQPITIDLTGTVPVVVSIKYAKQLGDDAWIV